MNEPTPVIQTDVDWRVRTVGEMTTLLRRGTAPFYVDDSNVMAIGQRCVTDADFDGSRSRPHSAGAMARVVTPELDDVLINSTGTGTIGRSVVFRDAARKYIVDGHVTVARPRQSELVSRWLNDVLRSPGGQCYLEARCYAGSTNQIELSSSALAAMPIAVPRVAEQRQVADVLDTLDDQIRITQSVITKIALAKSALYQRFFDDPGLPRVPLGDVAEVRNGTTPSRGRADYWERGSIAWLASGKVNDYRIQSASELVTERAVSESNLRILPAGSVVIGMIGQGKTRGMSARADIDAAINQNLAGVIPGPELRGDFLHHYLVHNYQKLRSGGRGSNQDALTTRLVSQFLVACPDLDIQARIARLLDCADQRLENERGLVAKLYRQKDGLLSDLLTGRARVPEGALS